jgi:hypothetical protein
MTNFILRATSSAALITALYACAPLPGQTPQLQLFSLGTPVAFEGLEIEVRSARNAAQFTNWIGQETRAGENFVVVDVIETNQGKTPLAPTFQPIYRLVDASGALYEPSMAHTIAINLGRAGRLQLSQVLNPKTPTRKEIVFEVPRQGYALTVLSPSSVRTRPDGSVRALGKSIAFELPL